MKSRLAAELDEAAAFEIYRWLLRVQARVFKLPCDTRHSYSDFVYYAPKINRMAARFRFGTDLGNISLRFRPQSEGDLGVRLSRACSQLLQSHDLALVWGADIPCLPASVFDQAIALFPQSVITLARDGGYAFLSLAAQKYSPAVFENIRWSTASTGADQMRALKHAGIEVVVSGKVTDLYHAMDLTRMVR